ncbi:Major facilitator-type transporter ecdD [Penicillium macrosclerotiorum]|uniref:Major facilitator-type transporter ecdD n=1 Tax=Penicillium macrosclerotiorum TaxID=303699 RepID=UPI00254843C3|nr:Major facilitator-type transporter ecdD [Penicillium macrosclerotiorum]KAJ5675991.1 Major facilitator-type transporter ecdD [Penicillium macrosclerotiorum]
MAQLPIGSSDVSRIEAPISFRAYLICGFACFGGMLFGYDSGYISGVEGMAYVKEHFGHAVSTDIDSTGYVLASWQKSLITSILSAGTFFGALIGGEAAERIGRRLTIMISCFIFACGVAGQVASHNVTGLVIGRLIAGFGVGGVSATVVLYVSEISPKKIRGTLVSIYQFAVTIGLLSASGATQGTSNREDAGSYRIPIAIQLVWAGILALGLFFLPESPRYLVKVGKLEQASASLASVRGQAADTPLIQAELAEIKANYEYESQLTSTSWVDCFKGGFSSPSGNLRRVFVGVFAQMFQQWTGVNFIFYYGTTFFQSVGMTNSFLMSTIMNIVNVACTPVSFWTIERFGRRTLLLYGAVVMCVCEFIVAIVGTADPGSKAANMCLIVFTCCYIAAFASTWGPACWVLVGEIFPLPIRAKGVALSTASNWLWNCIIAIITPYMVDTDKGNLGVKVFFVWGGCLIFCFLFAFLCVSETKGLSLEQIDRMLEETSPRTSAAWKPHDTFANDMGLTKGGETVEEAEKV